MMDQEEFSAASFFRFLGEGKLVASQCLRCGDLHLPPRPLCPRCFGQAMAWQELRGEGKVVSFTSIAVVPTFMAQEGYGRERPYVVAVVELAEGPRISAQLVDVDAQKPEQLSIGMPVEARFLERGDGENKQTFLAFRPKG
ncbi:MAG TPA: Zn-ribbon domain-containing OB-fold protein [Dehalococcoidia bacterium]|nr:Zn-ribbon domain-containing OB-fold protein [Dehalococcoidia bacterium]HLB29620.1 Zn-ribbon domain-containing OB-fold protein [Dehalococcoidia bacterium]